MDKVMGNGNSAIREPVASKLIGMAKDLAEQMQELNNRVAGRLESVSREEQPVPDTKADKVEDAWPRLFSELRQQFRSIQQNIHSIHGSIERLEV